MTQINIATTLVTLPKSLILFYNQRIGASRSFTHRGSSACDGTVTTSKPRMAQLCCRQTGLILAFFTCFQSDSTHTMYLNLFFTLDYAKGNIYSYDTWKPEVKYAIILETPSSFTLGYIQSSLAPKKKISPSWWSQVRLLFPISFFLEAVWHTVVTLGAITSTSSPIK